MAVNVEKNKNEVEAIDYEAYSLGKIKLLILMGVFFFLGFVFYFPFVSKTHHFIASTITNIPGCKLSYNSLEIEMFMPKVILNDLSIPSSCSGTASPLFIDQAKVWFMGPSFSPLGISTSVDAKLDKNMLEIDQSIGFNSQVFRIEDNTIDLRAIKRLASLPVDMSGDVNISALVQTSKAGIEEASVNINSKNLLIPAQTVQIFPIPELNLRVFSLKAEQLNPKTLQIRELVIGDLGSPIRAKFKGNININPRSFMNSQLDLIGEFAISNKLLSTDNFSMLKFFLNQYNQKDGFYQVKLTGTIRQPRPSTL
jgi:type II secretion system protein N